MKPKAGQWWFPDAVAAGSEAVRVAVFIVGQTTEGRTIYQCNRHSESTDLSEDEERWKYWHHEPRCTGWDLVVPEPQPATHCRIVCQASNADGVICPDDSCDIEDGLREPPSSTKDQPAEDPDEWVIQDRVPIRTGDRGWWENARFPLPSSPEQMVPVDIECDEFKQGLRHGYVEKHLRNATFHVYCRRHDLPKVEQVKTDAGHDWSYHEKQKLQPQKTRVRLWKNAYGSVMSNPDCENIEGWQELHHDSEGFYTID